MVKSLPSGTQMSLVQYNELTHQQKVANNHTVDERGSAEWIKSKLLCFLSGSREARNLRCRLGKEIGGTQMSLVQYNELTHQQKVVRTKEGRLRRPSFYSLNLKDESSD
jgi:hypothetical protein